MRMSSKFLVVLSLLSFSFLSQSSFAAETEKAVETAPATEATVAPADCFYPDGQCSSPAAEAKEEAPVEEAEATDKEASE